jgi:hypothetical protein
VARANAPPLSAAPAVPKSSTAIAESRLLATAQSQCARRGRQFAHLVDSSPGVRCHEHRTG